MLSFTSSLLPPCEPFPRSMPTYRDNWRAPSICPSTPSVCQSIAVQRGKKGECMVFWVADREGEEDSTAWWWDSPQRYRCLFFRWSQNFCHLISFLPLVFFLIHISTSFILFPLCLFPINFSLLSYHFFPIFLYFFPSQNEILHFQVTFWLSSCGGISLLWLCSIAGLGTYFHCRALLPRKTWTSLNCSALEKTRLRRSMMLKGRMTGKCSLTCNIPDSSRKLGRPDQRKAGPDCLTSAQNYLWASNQEVLTPSTDPLFLFSKKFLQTLVDNPGAVSSHQGKQVSNWITFLEVWWMHWCDHFRNFSLKEEFKERRKIIWRVMLHPPDLMGKKGKWGIGTINNERNQICYYRTVQMVR